MRLFRSLPLSILIVSLLCLAPSAQAIVIDGSANDWAAVPRLPLGGSADALTPFGEIKSLRLSQDNDFIFVLIEFEEARPFDPPDRQLHLKNGLWDDFSYLEIDSNGDGQWDYRTRMVPGKRIGRNNLTVLRSHENNPAGAVMLHPEGSKDYLPLGPRAFFVQGGQAVEQRIPRKPLGFDKGRIFVRAMVTYMDPSRGVNQWSTSYCPEGGQWIGLDLATLPPAEMLNYASDSVNRALEPFMVRDALGMVRESPSTRLMSDYIYPRATPPPFVPQVVKQTPEPAPQQPHTQPALVIGPGGQVIRPGAEIQPDRLEPFEATPSNYVPMDSEEPAPQQPQQPPASPPAAPQQTQQPPAATPAPQTAPPPATPPN